MKVMVTGCEGQVGFSLKEELAALPWEVLAFSRRELDITDADAVNNAVVDFSPDVVINAAAYTAVDLAESETELAFQINAEGPKNLAKACERKGSALFHISTDYVFSGGETGLYKEGDPVAPTGVYGRSKYAGEQAVIETCSHHIVLRTAWVFGEHGNNFVKTMLRLGRQRDSIAVVGDQYGGPTYAGDIAKALVRIAGQLEFASSNKALDSFPWGVFHFSGSPQVSWFDFATEIFDSAQAHALFEPPRLDEISTEQYPTAAKRPVNSKLDCRKINTHFGIDPSNWQSALQGIKNYE